MADSNYKIKKGGTTRGIASYLSNASGASVSGESFSDGSTYYYPADSTKYAIYQKPTGHGNFNSVWATKRSIVGSHYLRGTSTTTPDFAARGYCPTFSNSSSWVPSSDTAQVKFVSGTGIQVKDGSGSWTTLSNTINTHIIIVEICGGGGGGGGGCVNKGNKNTHNYAGGSGGGGGGYLAHVVRISDGTPLVLYRGAGGAGGSSTSEGNGSAGSAGGKSYVTKNGTTIFSAPGGGAGQGAKHVTGATESSGQSTTVPFNTTNFVYKTSGSDYSEFSYCIGANGKAGAYNNETSGSKKSGTNGADSSIVGTIFKRSNQSGGQGGQGSSCSGYNRISCGGGGGASAMGKGGGGRYGYKSGSNYYYSTSGGGPGAGGGGGGGYYGFTEDGTHVNNGGADGGAGYIGICYETTYPES